MDEVNTTIAHKNIIMSEYLTSAIKVDHVRRYLERKVLDKVLNYVGVMTHKLNVMRRCIYKPWVCYLKANAASISTGIPTSGTMPPTVLQNNNQTTGIPDTVTRSYISLNELSTKFRNMFNGIYQGFRYVFKRWSISVGSKAL